MKTKYIIIISAILLIIAGVFSSCEKIITFDGEKTKPFLVMNSILKADSAVKVHISKSRFFLDDNNEMSDINTANVKMWVNDVEQAPFQSLGNGIYSSDYIPKTGDNIKITATANSFDEISSTTIIPELPQIISVDTIYSYNTDGGYTSRILNFDIKFKENQNSDDYYLIYGSRRDYYHRIDTNTEEYSEYEIQLLSDDVIFKNENSGNFRNENIFEAQSYSIFSDALINGKEYTLRMKTHIYDDPYQQGNQKKSYKIYFQKITKEWYLYLRTISKVNADFSLFSEPVQVYSNIQNGLGILGATNSYMKEFTIGE